MEIDYFADPTPKMKIAVLGDSRDSFIKIMALGLIKMLSRIGSEATYFDKGLAAIDFTYCGLLKNTTKNSLKKLVNFFVSNQHQSSDVISSSEVGIFYDSLRDYDLIIVVCPIPTAFIMNRLTGIDKIREQYSIPIVLYQNYYLPIRGKWLDKINSKNDSHLINNQSVLNRYDWYLTSTIASEKTLLNASHPLSVIGHDLSSSDLHDKDKGTFKVLLDFTQPGFGTYRRLQIAALQQTNTPYTMLHGHYSISEIRHLYRTHSALFLSFKESFGLPIVENQLCGSKIFTPYKNWCPGHLITHSPNGVDEKYLGSNFVIYDNCIDKLKNAINECKSNDNPNRVIKNFKIEYPLFNGAGVGELENFLNAVKSGKINDKSHREHHIN